MMDMDFAALSLEDEEEIVPAQRGPVPVKEEEEFCLVRCFLTTSIIHFPTMRSTLANIWTQLKEFKLQI